MYFRKMRPSATCLYSAASMLPRNLSAAAHNVASNDCFGAASRPILLLLLAATRAPRYTTDRRILHRSGYRECIDPPTAGKLLPQFKFGRAAQCAMPALSFACE